MHTAEYNGINDFLVSVSRRLLKYGKRRDTRGYICYELPEPAIFKITNPTARIVTIPARKWNKTLPYAESLWMASGRNDIEYIAHYLPRMKEFSDDGEFMRGGYGPRLRHFNGRSMDYKIKGIIPTSVSETDQLRYVCECFNADRETRRATISFGDVNKDSFDNGALKQTKDIPCTRELHFIKQAASNKLDLIVKMRSNDLIWGASGVNIFNYTFMLEYMASILSMEVGNYYHFVDNIHYYERHKEMVRELAAYDYNIEEESPYTYDTSFHSLEDFDILLAELCTEEGKMKQNMANYEYHEFKDPFFRDWYNILYSYNTNNKVNYINIALNRLK